MEIIAQILVELSCGQAPFCENWSVEVQNDLEGQAQSHPFSNVALLVPRCTIGANLVILAETGDELSRRQGRYGQTDGRTDRQTDRRADGQAQAITMTLRQFCRGVKMISVI